MRPATPPKLRRPCTALALTCCVATLVACASSPATRYFTIRAAPAAAVAPSAYQGPPIEVRGVQVPPAMDRLEMVGRLAPGQLNVLDFDHWAAPLDRLARQALTEDLAQRLPKDKVVIPGAAWPPTRASLSVDILSFDHTGGTASMTLSWALAPPTPADGTSGSAPPAPVGATLRVESTAGGDAASTAQAWSDLLGQVADRIAASLNR